MHTPLNNFNKLTFMTLLLGVLSIALAPIHSLADPLVPTDLNPSDLRGVNFMDPILTSKESGYKFKAPTDYVTKSLNMIKDYGFNNIRVPYYWEAYIADPDAFLQEAEFIAKTAEENELYVIFDFHHWFTSSYFARAHSGFPSFILEQYPVSGVHKVDAASFWEDFWNNSIDVNGEKVWDLQLEFMTAIINKVDRYDSVLGYEILNEPSVFDDSQYEKVGTYHTYMGEKLRLVTDKTVFFQRASRSDFDYARNPDLEPLVVPSGVNNIVYTPHLYTPPYPGSQGEKQIERFARYSAEWGVPVYIGEFAAKT